MLESFHPGDRFRRYSWTGPLFGELSETARHPGARAITRRPHTPVEIAIPSLKDAIRAEIAVEYWGGHIGTSEQSFRINDGPWMPLPQPIGTPSRPECYHRTILGNPAVDIPLWMLREGSNTIAFHAGPQICGNFDWGFFWIYAATIRVYESSEVPDGPVRTTSGSGDTVISDGAEFLFEPSDSDSFIRASLIGRYVDYDWSGTGRAYSRHYHLREGAISGHVGDVKKTQPVVTWNSTWVPDQAHPVEIIPVVEYEDGLFVVGATEAFRLHRTDRSVVMYSSDAVPEAFGVRLGEGKSSRFRDVRRESIGSAMLAIHSWSGAHADEILLNGHVLTDRIGRVHDYSHDLVAVPPEYIMDGTNVFSIYSRTREHAAEINWPGPALLIEYEK